MPNDHGRMVSVSQQDIATLPIADAIEAYAPNFAAVLPANVSLDHFQRMVVTAINTNPDLARADRRSLFNACVKCASDGLLPDGREAALVVFNTKVRKKVGGAWQEEWVKLAQFMPMVAGIRKRMRNSGEVISATAEVVCENDEFDYALGDNPFIRHKPAPFGVSRGRPVGAYAIIKLRQGEPLRDVMRKEEIEAARSKSRAKDSLMWTDFWGEGAKKTVLRRCAKAAPQSAVMESLLGHDDDLPELPPLTEIAPPDREPPRAASVAHMEPEAPATIKLKNGEVLREIITHIEPEDPDPAIGVPAYLVIDCDGEEHEFHCLDVARDALADVIAEATRRGAGHVAAARENNAELLSEVELHYSPGAGAEPESITADASRHDGEGRTAGSTPATGANHSPAGNVDPNEPHGAVSTPAGDAINDMFGGPARPPAQHVFSLPRDPKQSDFQAFADWVDTKLDDGVLGPALRADNSHAINLLKRADFDLYLTIQKKLGAK